MSTDTSNSIFLILVFPVFPVFPDLILRTDATINHVVCEARKPWVSLTVSWKSLTSAPATLQTTVGFFLKDSELKTSVFNMIIMVSSQLLFLLLFCPRTLLFYPPNQHFTKLTGHRLLKNSFRACNLTTRSIIPKSQKSFFFLKWLSVGDSSSDAWAKAKAKAHHVIHGICVLVLDILGKKNHIGRLGQLLSRKLPGKRTKWSFSKI